MVFLGTLVMQTASRASCYIFRYPVSQLLNITFKKATFVHLLVNKLRVKKQKWYLKLSTS